MAGGIGCSDLAWRRERSFIGHNEDGTPENVGQCALLTLALDGLPRPSLPSGIRASCQSNAFAVTGDGLVWTIDHLRPPRPATGRAGISSAAGCSDRPGHSTRPSATWGRIPPQADRLHDRRPGGAHRQRRGRGRTPCFRGSRARDRAACTGTPTTDATFPAPSRRPEETA